jgi:hypothetical protein
MSMKGYLMREAINEYLMRVAIKGVHQERQLRGS